MGFYKKMKMKKGKLKKHLVKFGNQLLDKHNLTCEVSHSDLENYFNKFNSSSISDYKIGNIVSYKNDIYFIVSFSSSRKKITIKHFDNNKRILLSIKKIKPLFHECDSINLPKEYTGRERDLVISFESIHELQNIYREYLNKELEIKITKEE